MTHPTLTPSWLHRACASPTFTPCRCARHRGHLLWYDESRASNSGRVQEDIPSGRCARIRGCVEALVWLLTETASFSLFPSSCRLASFFPSFPSLFILFLQFPHLTSSHSPPPLSLFLVVYFSTPFFIKCECFCSKLLTFYLVVQVAFFFLMRCFRLRFAFEVHICAGST